MHLAGLILGMDAARPNVRCRGAMPDRSSAATLVAQNDWSSSPGPATGGRPAAGTGQAAPSIRPPSLDAGATLRRPARPTGGAAAGNGRRGDRSRRRVAASRWHCWLPFRRAPIAASNLKSC